MHRNILIQLFAVLFFLRIELKKTLQSLTNTYLPSSIETLVRYEKQTETIGELAFVFLLYMSLII